MDVASLTASAAGPQPAVTQRGFEALASEDFFQLIITDLLNQDPMEPMDNEKLLQQLSSIREMELNQQITTSLQSLTDQQRAGTATGLIGKLVGGSRGLGGGPMTGVVTGVQFDATGAAILQLGPGRALPLSDVQEVTSLDQLRESLVDNVVTAQQLQDGQPKQVRGTVTDVTVQGGQVFLELDSGESVGYATVQRVQAG